MSTTPVSSTGKKPYWETDGPDPSVKTADETENKVSGDAYDYKDSTKAGLEADALASNLNDVVGLFVGKLGDGAKSLKAARFVADELHAVATGNKDVLEAAANMGAYLAEYHLGEYIKVGGIEASYAFTMLKAIYKAIPKTLELQKATEQLYHDEGIRLVVAEHFKGQMPGATYAGVEKGMSTFGRTYRKTQTFDAQVAAFEAAAKAQPALAKAMQDRFWLGKCAALEMGMKSKADLDRALDPKNMDPRAVSFRTSWNDPTNVAFRLGATALVDEASLGTAEADALYAKDVAAWTDMKAKIASLPPITLQL